MREYTGRRSNEPMWQSRRRAGWVDPDASQWLCDAGSLTRRLQRHCQGKFRVELLRQQWQRPLLNEAIALDIAPRQLALIRHVYLYCDATPWVFARTIIPQSTLRGEQRRLKHLGTRPLGAYLFSSPGMRRDPIEIVKLHSGQPLYQLATARGEIVSSTIWGRRSRFYLNERPLLVCELFLPDLIRS